MGDLYNNPVPSTSHQEPNEKKLPVKPLAKNIAANRQLRACMNCGLLKIFHQFYNEGCDNCELIFHFRGDAGRIVLFTSLEFDGIVGLPINNHGWQTKLVNIGDKFCVGTYARHISGRIFTELLQLVSAQAGGEDNRLNIMSLVLTNYSAPTPNYAHFND